MREYRVTKYDPARRDSAGRFPGDDWTDFGDIGRDFGGKRLTEAAYLRAETVYLAAATAFLTEAGVSAVRVEGVEDYDGVAGLADGDVLPLSAFPAALRRVLRCEFWCQFEAERGFVHVGYEYYMYVGVAIPCPASIVAARTSGLFVEEYRSPIRERE